MMARLLGAVPGSGFSTMLSTRNRSSLIISPAITPYL
ncbi:Uncharacterised protein [Vibrio cholerae]|nr:Uncharacterised protein [Vibrio cholerae]